MAKKGIKVKRSKSLYLKKKSTFRKALELAGIIAVTGGLCLLGFAAARPILDYFSGERSNVADWQTAIPDNIENNETEEIYEDETTKEQEGTPDNGLAFYAPVSALQNKASLSSNLITAKSAGYTRLVIDLKDSAGNIWYKSAIPKLAGDHFIKGDLELSEIFAIFKENEVEPIVRISTLADKNAPSFIGEISYWFADQSSKWIDDRLENGGKLWADPTKAATAQYLKEITEEIREAGFDEIILSNTVYPFMRPYDVSILPANVTGSGRYSALVNIVNECAGKSPVYLEMQLMDIVQNLEGFRGTAEVLKGQNDLNNNVKIVAVYGKLPLNSELNLTETNSINLSNDINEQVSYLFSAASKNTGGLEIIPCIDRDGMSDAEIAQAIIAAALASPGHSVMVK